MTTDTIEKPATAVATTEPAQGSLKATALASFAPIEAHLTTLAARYDKVAFAGLATPKGLAAAKSVRLELREQGRYAVQRLQKRLKDEANDLKKVVDDRSVELIAIIQPVEENVHAQIEAEETRREAEKAEKARLAAEEAARLAAIEAERVAKLQAGIAAIRGYVARCQEVDMMADRIAAGITHLDAQVLGEEWGDHLQLAQAAQAESLAAMRSLHASALAREQRARELEAQRVENERVAAELKEQRAQLAAQQAELDRQAAERAERERAEFAAEYERTEAERRLAADALAVDHNEFLKAELPTDSPVIAEQLAFIARRGNSPLVELQGVMQEANDMAQAVAGIPQAASSIPVGDVTVLTTGFELPDFDGDAPLDPATHAAELEADAAQFRAVLIDATDMLDELIVAHSPKRMAAGYFARVAALRDAARIPRLTTTTKE